MSKRDEATLLQWISTIKRDHNIFIPTIRDDNGLQTIGTPLDLYEYTRIDGFKPDYIHLYMVISKMYNEKYGCSVGKLDEIADKSGKSLRSIQRDIIVLEKVGLIHYTKSVDNKNYYICITPKSDDQVRVMKDILK
ncbi:TPA: hypothetical protein QCV77_006545 [Bacillus thuringiensis]|nr:hypothetical protein [Bacillus thuringiensis]